MAQIGRRIYYETSTGNAIQDTGERSGNVVETTIEQDFAAYVALAERVSSTVGCLQLDYGKFAQDFAECNGYRVDVSGETPSLLFSYSDPSEPESPTEYRPPLSEQVGALEDESAMLALELVGTQIRLDQAEVEKAALLLELVEKKGGTVDGLVRKIKKALRRRSV